MDTENTVNCHSWPNSNFCTCQQSVHATQWARTRTTSCMQPVALIISDETIKIKGSFKNKITDLRFYFHLFHLLDKACFEKATSLRGLHCNCCFAHTKVSLCKHTHSHTQKLPIIHLHSFWTATGVYSQKRQTGIHSTCALTQTIVLVTSTISNFVRKKRWHEKKSWFMSVSVHLSLHPSIPPPYLSHTHANAHIHTKQLWKHLIAFISEWYCMDQHSFCFLQKNIVLLTLKFMSLQQYGAKLHKSSNVLCITKQSHWLMH